MQEMDQGLVDKVLGGLIAPSHNFLERAYVDGSCTEGVFDIHKRPQYIHQIRNLTSWDAEPIIAGLGFPSVAYWISQDRFDFVGEKEKENPVRTLFDRVKLGEVHKYFPKSIFVFKKNRPDDPLLVHARMSIGPFEEREKDYSATVDINLNQGAQRWQVEVLYRK